MKGFKDVVKADISNVFADTNIFFEVMNVDGKDMRVMLDADALKETKFVPGKHEHADGLYAADVMIYIPVDDYGPKPKIGKLMVLGKKQYVITDCVDEAGMYTFTLKRNRL